MAGYFGQDMQIKVQLFAWNVSHKILYEVTYCAEIIYINVYSRYMQSAHFASTYI